VIVSPRRSSLGNDGSSGALGLAEPIRKARPTAILREVRDLIRRMSIANPLWGSPRIVSELRMIGIDLPKSTVAKYMIRHRKPPSATWRAFLKNHISEIVAVDFFVVPTVRNQILFVFLILAHHRRRVLHCNVTPTRPPSGRPSRSSRRSVGQRTRFLLRDRDGIYGEHFAVG